MTSTGASHREAVRPYSSRCRAPQAAPLVAKWRHDGYRRANPGRPGRIDTHRDWRDCHVYVTARRQTREISKSSVPRALLVLRLWYEHGSASPLRAELTRTTDVDENFGPQTILTDVEDVCDAVQAWLTDFLGRAAGTGSGTSSDETGPIRLP